MRSKLIYDLLLLAAFSLVAFVFAAHLLLRPGLISGLDWPYPPARQMWKVYLESILYSWSRVGVFTGDQSFIVYVNSWVIVNYLVSLIGLSVEIVTKLSLILLLQLAWLSCYVLLRFIRISRLCASLGAFFYASTPVFLDWTSLSGFSGIASVYALFPLTLFFYMKAISTSRISNRIFYCIASAVCMIGVYPIFGIYLGMATLVVYSTLSILFARDRVSVLKLHISAIFLVALLTFVYEVPALLLAIATQAAASPGFYNPYSQPISEFTVLDVITTRVSYYPAYERVSQSVPLLILAVILVPSAGYLTLTCKKSRMLLTSALLAIVYIGFLSSPLSTELIRHNFLLMGIFRDKSKMVIPIILIDCVLLSEFFNLILHKKKNVGFKILITMVLMLLLASYSSPWPVSLQSSGFGNIVFPKAYYETYDFLQNRSTGYSTIWLPFGQNQINLEGSTLSEVNDFFSMMTPSGLNVLNKRYWFVAQFWLSNLFYNPSNFSLAKVAGVFNIKYIVTRNDITFAQWGTSLDSPIWGRQFNLTPIVDEAGFMKTLDLGQATVWMNPWALPRVYPATYLVVSSGDLNSMARFITTSDGYRTAVWVPASEMSNDLLFNLAPYVIYGNYGNTDNVDLLLPKLRSTNDTIVVDPGQYAGISPFKGWSNVHQWWYQDPLQAAPEQVALIENNTGTLYIPIEVPREGYYYLWVKVLTGPKSSNIQFALSAKGSVLNRTIPTHEAGPETLRWFALTNSDHPLLLHPGSYMLSIFSQEGRNAVARIIISSVRSFQESRYWLEGILSRSVNESKFSRALDGGPYDFMVQPTVDYHELNPTLYKVDIVNATTPYFLVFLQSYDPGWILSSGYGEQFGMHFKVWGYANGWWINRTGSYTLYIEYLPQSMYSIGLVVSFVSLMVSAAYCVALGISTMRDRVGKRK